MLNTKQPLLSNEKSTSLQKPYNFSSLLCVILLLFTLFCVSNENTFVRRFLETAIGANKMDADVLTAWESEPDTPDTSLSKSEVSPQPQRSGKAPVRQEVSPTNDDNGAGPSTSASDGAEGVFFPGEPGPSNSGPPETMPQIQEPNWNDPANKALLGEVSEESAMRPENNIGPKCNDPENGYEKQFGVCGSIKIEHNFQRTVLESTSIPMVVDQLGRCRKEKCSKADKFRCCRFRQNCFPWFKRDVVSGCPDGLVPNPFDGAFCRTFPCTPADADICCIKPAGEVYTRRDWSRSKYARVSPSDDAAVTNPKISFGFNQKIWIDVSKNVTVGNDMWVPVVNFMETWGDGKGWRDPAWIKYSKRGHIKYSPISFDNNLAVLDDMAYMYRHLAPSSLDQNDPEVQAPASAQQISPAVEAPESAQQNQPVIAAPAPTNVQGDEEKKNS